MVWFVMTNILCIGRSPIGHFVSSLLHPDSFIMEKVDLVMVGAEGVAESGGIINKVEG